MKDLKIKISGCFNSCGQHHVADIGFYGNSRKAEGRTVPHFQVILGGQWDENAGSYGLAQGSVPSKAIPDLIDTLTSRYAAEREGNEKFREWVGRVGKRGIREIIKPYMAIPAYDSDPSFFADWGDTREFTIGDLGVGECAGEVVSLFGIEVVKAEAQAFDAQLALEESDIPQAYELAYQAMLTAARSLVRSQFIDVTWDADQVVKEWKTRYFDNEIFFHKYMHGKFGQYLIDRHENPVADPDPDEASRAIERAQLFIDACHECDAKLEAQLQSGGGIELEMNA